MLPLKWGKSLKKAVNLKKNIKSGGSRYSKDTASTLLVTEHVCLWGSQVKRRPYVSDPIQCGSNSQIIYSSKTANVLQDLQSCMYLKVNIKSLFPSVQSSPFLIAYIGDDNYNI